MNECKWNKKKYSHIFWLKSRQDGKTDEQTNRPNKHGFYRLKLGKEYNRKKEVELE